MVAHFFSTSTCIGEICFFCTGSSHCFISLIPAKYPAPSYCGLPLHSHFPFVLFSLVRSLGCFHNNFPAGPGAAWKFPFPSHHIIHCSNPTAGHFGCWDGTLLLSTPQAHTLSSVVRLLTVFEILSLRALVFSDIISHLTHTLPRRSHFCILHRPCEVTRVLVLRAVVKEEIENTTVGKLPGSSLQRRGDRSGIRIAVKSKGKIREEGGFTKYTPPPCTPPPRQVLASTHPPTPSTFGPPPTSQTPSNRQGPSAGRIPV